MKKLGLVLVALLMAIMLPAITAHASIVMDGSTTFANASFNAVVYWQVWSPGDSSSPWGSISDYGYYYQVKNSGSGADKALTQFGVDNHYGQPIDSVGYLTSPNLDSLTGTIAPDSSTADVDNSGLWTFSPTKIPLGSSSYLLYYTSPFAPTFLNGGVQAGSFNTQASVPGPVPEPATTGLLGLGLIGFVGRMIRRKVRA